MTTEARPAFYALASGGWRDYVTLLHPPYTLWHLSYVAIGAGLAPDLRPGRLAAALAAFLLAMGVGAHALDELRGRPLRTRIPEAVLAVLAAVSISGAVAIGIVVSFAAGFWLLAFIAFGAFIVVAYNLELFGGRLHTPFWFAFSWGSFPLLTGYFVTAERLRAEALLAAAFAYFLSLVQRRLSTPVRMVRRRVASVSGNITFKDGRVEPVTAEALMGTPESALRVLTVAVVTLAAALLVLHLV